PRPSGYTSSLKALTLVSTSTLWIHIFTKTLTHVSTSGRLDTISSLKSSHSCTHLDPLDTHLH
ncbi:hypothetical protein, partial [Bacillus sp. P14.5]|uniref:hypothetical protein n=1 Tax=Bacillus sp. P14.5 TaxID=1983400 RepID=UPI00196695FC